jgi:TPR repeat protein
VTRSEEIKQVPQNYGHGVRGYESFSSYSGLCSASSAPSYSRSFFRERQGPRPEASFLWMTKGAEQGDAYAQYAMGRDNEMGLGVRENPAEAVRWYQMSADQKDAKRNLSLG